MMEFEWNSDKSDKILAERGFSLEDAAAIFAGQTLIAEDSRTNYGEIRYRAIGFYEEQCYTVVFTDRFYESGRKVRRLITAWKANKKECSLWQSFVNP